MKKLVYGIAFLLLLIVITSCSSKETPVIVKEETNHTDTDGATLIEESEKNDTEEYQMMIEFTLENEQLTIDLEQVPILKSYLAQIDNRQQAIAQMELTKLDIESAEPLYLLNFAEVEQMGSYLLLDPSDNGNSFLLTDRASFIEVIPSPEGGQLLFNFERTVTDQSWTTNKLVVLDLDTWSSPTLTSTDGHNIMIDKFKWPVQHVAWLDNQTVQLSIPAIAEASTEQLSNWYQAERATKQVQLTINTK